MRRPLLLFLGLLLSGCAARQMDHAPETAARTAPGDPREELRDLVQRIQERRRALGLPVAGKMAAEEPLRAPAEPPAPGGAPPPATAAAPREAPPAKGGRCGDVCRVAQDICRFGERICRLAGEIGDADSARSCEQARADCAEGRTLCRDCR